MNHSLIVKVEIQHEVPVLLIPGDVTFQSIDAVRQGFSDLRLLVPRLCIIDLSKCNLLASVGLGEMAKFLKWAEENGSQVRLVCSHAQVLDVLEISGMTSILRIFSSLEAALPKN